MMKRSVVSILFIICASIGVSQNTIKTAKDLDLLWNRYFENKDFSAITAIVGVFEMDDEFRNEINFFLRSNSGTDRVTRLIELLKEVYSGVSEDNTSVLCDYNIDGVSFHLFLNEYYRPRIVEIGDIVESERNTFEMMKVKGAAIWSLENNCANHEEIYKHVESIKSNFSTTTQFTVDRLILHKH
ncbi:MAG: hypothetical protein Q8O15_02145 [Rectinemataceae bacterium]|nr:hypothetical protein [Rectinemataceae bacterium]